MSIADYFAFFSSLLHQWRLFCTETSDVRTKRNNDFFDVYKYSNFALNSVGAKKSRNNSTKKEFYDVKIEITHKICVTIFSTVIYAHISIPQQNESLGILMKRHFLFPTNS